MKNYTILKYFEPLSSWRYSLSGYIDLEKELREEWSQGRYILIALLSAQVIQDKKREKAS